MTIGQGNAGSSRERVRALWVSCRPQQWIKNLFVLLPVVFAQRLFSLEAWLHALWACGVFCLASSGVYLLNDVADRRHDRVHPLKRRRPIASGRLPVPLAVGAAAMSIGFAVLLAWGLRPSLAAVVALYVGTNWLYTRWLRDVVILDVFGIAFFFLLRIVAGLLVLEVGFSPWMLIATALLALFLALNKRRYELTKLRRRAAFHREVLKKYDSYFIDQMCAAITAAVMVVYILYVLDPRVVARFGSRNLIFSIPCVFYGVFRYQYLVFKRGLGGDPSRILLSDRMMQLNVAAWVVICSLAIYSRNDWLPFLLE